MSALNGWYEDEDDDFAYIPEVDHGIEESLFAEEPYDLWFRSETLLPEQLKEIDRQWQLIEAKVSQSEFEQIIGMHAEWPGRSIIRSDRARIALWWLAYKMDLRPEHNLSAVLGALASKGSASLYKRRLIRDKDGGKRLLHIPHPDLLALQRRISQRLLTADLRDPHTHGYLGGNSFSAIQPHAKGKRTMLMFDVQNAFYHVSADTVRNSLIAAGFSWYVAEFIQLICTYWPVEESIQKRYDIWHSFLPQGAPTSAKLFQLSCHKLDARFGRMAAKYKGVYTRYADNVFFSLRDEQFPVRLKHAMVDKTNDESFPVHKIRVVKSGLPVHALGLNIVGGKVRNSRKLLRSLRGALYHLEFALDSGGDYGFALSKVHGYMAIAVQAALPAKLKARHRRCMKKVRARKTKDTIQSNGN